MALCWKQAWRRCGVGELWCADSERRLIYGRNIDAMVRIHE